jgi:hypothetical protein
LMIHVLTVWIVLLYLPAKGLILALCPVSFCWNLNRQRKVKKFFWDERGGWKIQNKNGEIYSVRRARKNICTPWMIGLNFNRKALIIFFDSMNSEAFRRLKVLVLSSR